MSSSFDFARSRQIAENEARRVESNLRECEGSSGWGESLYTLCHLGYGPLWQPRDDARRMAGFAARLKAKRRVDGARFEADHS